MTFASEEVRLAFHSLPTELQVEMSRMEERFAAQGSGLFIADVVQWDNGVSEVVIRITFKKQSNAVPRDCRSLSEGTVGNE